MLQDFEKIRYKRMITEQFELREIRCCERRISFRGLNKIFHYFIQFRPTGSWCKYNNINT
jgi:hypothetical protein